MKFPTIDHLFRMKGTLIFYIDNGFGLKKDNEIEVKSFFTEKGGLIRKTNSDGLLVEVDRRGILRLPVDIREYVNNPDVFIEYNMDGFVYNVEHININRNPDGTVHHIRMDVV